MIEGIDRVDAARRTTRGVMGEISRRSAFSMLAAGAAALFAPHGFAAASAFQAFDTPIPAPELRLAGIDGRAEALGDHAGRSVAVHFWASWCVPCRVELPALMRFRDGLSPANGVVMAVNIGETAAKAAAFLDAAGLAELRPLLDPDRSLQARWRVGALPLTYLIDPAQRLVAFSKGPVDWDAVDARQAFAALSHARPEALDNGPRNDDIARTRGQTGVRI